MIRGYTDKKKKDTGQANQKTHTKKNINLKKITREIKKKKTIKEIKQNDRKDNPQTKSK